MFRIKARDPNLCQSCGRDPLEWEHRGNDVGGVQATWVGRKCPFCKMLTLTQVICDVTSPISMMLGDSCDFKMELKHLDYQGEQPLTGKKLDLEDEEDRTAAIKHLFGSLGRFELASWILRRPDTVFYGSLYAEETGKYSASVFNGGQLEKLVEMGLIERVDGREGQASGRTTKYRRVPNPLWQIYELGVKIFGDVEAQQQKNLRKSLMGLSEHLKGGRAAAVGDGWGVDGHPVV